MTNTHKTFLILLSLINAIKNTCDCVRFVSVPVLLAAMIYKASIDRLDTNINGF